MGCLIALVALAMAGGGGYGWYSTGDFLWWGVVCVVGLIILFVYACALGVGGDAIDGLGDINFD